MNGGFPTQLVVHDALTGPVRRGTFSRRSFLYGMKTLLVATLVSALLSACGGGTRGTGDEVKSLVVGRVVDTTGAPLPSATVTQLETGDSTETDSTGAFSLNVAVTNEEATLLIERDGFEGTATISGLSTEPQATPTELTITVDLVSGIVTAVTVNDVDPNPPPQPTAEPTVNPEPTPGDNDTKRQHVLSGIVVNQSGTPVVGVTLSVAGSDSVVSGANGRFSLPFSTSSSRVRVAVKYGVDRGSFVVTGLPKNRDARIHVTVQLTTSLLPNNINEGVSDPAFSVGVSNIAIR